MSEEIALPSEPSWFTGTSISTVVLFVIVPIFIAFAAIGIVLSNSAPTQDKNASNIQVTSSSIVLVIIAFIPLIMCIMTLMDPNLHIGSKIALVILVSITGSLSRV